MGVIIGVAGNDMVTVTLLDRTITKLTACRYRVIISPNGTEIIRIKIGREIRNKIQARNRRNLTGVPKEIIIDATSEIGP